MRVFCVKFENSLRGAKKEIKATPFPLLSDDGAASFSGTQFLNVNKSSTCPLLSSVPTMMVDLPFLLVILLPFCCYLGIF